MRSPCFVFVSCCCSMGFVHVFFHVFCFKVCVRVVVACVFQKVHVFWSRCFHALWCYVVSCVFHCFSLVLMFLFYVHGFIHVSGMCVHRCCSCCFHCFMYLLTVFTFFQWFSLASLVLFTSTLSIFVHVVFVVFGMFCSSIPRPTTHACFFHMFSRLFLCSSCVFHCCARFS